MWRFFLGLPLDLIRLIGRGARRLEPAVDAFLVFVLQAGARLVCGLLLMVLAALGGVFAAVRWFALPDLVAEPPTTGLMAARMLAGGAVAVLIAAWALGDGHGERFLAFTLGQCGAVLGLGSVLAQSIAQEKRHG